MSGFRRERTAIRQYYCDWDCGDPIEPGTRYSYSTLPPNSEPMYTETWSDFRAHGPRFEDCPVRAQRKDTT